MSVYMTEEEQLDAIKRWWGRYGSFITVLISLILLLIAGYNYWRWHSYKVTQQASNTYEQLMLAFSNQDDKKTQSFANQLIKNYGKTIYADAAQLTLAKQSVQKHQYSEAKTHLKTVAAHASMPALKQIANIRLARLLTAEQAYDEALDALRRLEDQAYTPMVNEIKGDIYAATGRYPQAIAAYRKAMNQAQSKGLGNLFLEMKTNALALKNHSLNLAKESLQAA